MPLTSGAEPRATVTWLHRPLARVPENALKFAVGILLSSFGVFWIGEGSRAPWFGGDWAILGLIAGFLAVDGGGLEANEQGQRKDHRNAKIA